MPFSSGTFSRVHDFTDDRDNGIRIQASRMDAEMDGIATGLSTALLKDGTQTATATIPFAAGISIIDNQKITLGTNSDITLQYDETTNDSLEIASNVEGAALGIVLKSDQGDDNADQHKLSIADGGVLTLGSKISGSFVDYLTHTPNSTVASSTLAVAGNLTVGGNLTLGSGAVLSEAELEQLDGITAGTVTASKAVVVDANKDIASFRNITLTGELDAGSLDISGDADIDGTLEADAMTLNGSAITTVATLSTGISNGNLPVFTSGVADDDFLRVNGTAIEGRSASEVLSDIGGQAALTFGISNTNIPIFTSGVADDDFLRVNGTSIEGRSASEVLSDIGASAVAGSSSIVTTGALNSGSITSGFGSIDTGSSTITTTGAITGGSLVADNITIDGTEIDLSSGDLTLDVAGDIILDADGQQIFLKNGGTHFGTLLTNATPQHFYIDSAISDGDLIFRGNDGGSTITALTLDMSASGDATFNNNITAENMFVAGNITHAGDNDTLIEFATDTITFDTGGSERMRIDSSGRVLIGSTSNTASADFDNLVVGNTSDTCGLTILSGGSSTCGIAFGDSAESVAHALVCHHADNSMRFNVSGNTERMRIDSSGNLLVGATSSNAGAFGSISPQILVAGTIPQVALHETDTDKDGYIGISSSTMFIQTADAIPIRFGTSDAERMRISDAGRVGIGNSNPNSAMLHVNQSAQNEQGIFPFLLHSSYTNIGILIQTVRSHSSAFELSSMKTNSGVDKEFNFRGDGEAFADGSFSGGGADYAEYFEWKDGNTDNEDRRGYTVVLDGNLIRKSTSDDAPTSIIGVVSATPVVVGDNAWNMWYKKYEKDVYGNYIYEEHTITEWTVENSDGEKEPKSYHTDKIPSDVTVPDDAVVKTYHVDENGKNTSEKFTRRKESSTYDESKTYIPREERNEWVTIGLVGKLKVNVGQTVGDRWIKMREISDTVHEYLVR